MKTIEVTEYTWKRLENIAHNGKIDKDGAIRTNIGYRFQVTDVIYDALLTLSNDVDIAIQKLFNLESK